MAEQRRGWTMLRVYVVAGSPQQGWCDVCLTSGRLRIPIYALSEGSRRSGPCISDLGWWEACSTCEPFRFTGDDGDAGGAGSRVTV